MKPTSFGSLVISAFWVCLLIGYHQTGSKKGLGPPPGQMGTPMRPASGILPFAWLILWFASPFSFWRPLPTFLSVPIPVAPFGTSGLYFRRALMAHRRK